MANFRSGITRKINKIWVHKGLVYCTLKGYSNVFVVQVSKLEDRDRYF